MEAFTFTVDVFLFQPPNISGVKIIPFYVSIYRYNSCTYLRMIKIGDVKDGNMETKFVGTLDWRLFYSS